MASATGVMVADEDTGVRDFVADLLRANGYQPVVAATGSAALAGLAERQVAVALVGGDLSDPSGGPLFQQIKRISPLTEIIILADAAGVESALDGLGEAAFACLPKPLENTPLLLQVRNAARYHGVRAELARQDADRLHDPDPLIELDASGAVVYLNQAAERIGPSLREAGVQHPLLAGASDIAAEPGRVVLRDVSDGGAIFEQRIVRLSDLGRVRIRLVDTGDCRRAEAALLESEAQYRRLFEGARDGMVLVDADSARVLEVNPRMVALFGYPREAYVGMTLGQCGPLRDVEACGDAFELMREQESVRREVVGIARVSGAAIDVELSASRSQLNGRSIVQLSFHDITAVRHHEARIRRINAFFSAIRRISEYLLVAESEDEIYRFICGTIGDLEHVAGVWIGLKLPDYTVMPVAWAGFDDATVAGFRARWDQDGTNFGIMGAAIREGRPVIVNDASGDRRYASWQTMLGRWNIRSGIGVPLTTDGETIGSITIFSDQPHAFDEEAVKFLGDIAADAAVGVRSLRLDKKLRATLNSLRMSLDGTVEAIARMVELRDPYTAGHQRRVAQLSSAIGRELGLPERRIEGLRVAGYLHDIGKIGIPAEILAKPGHLNDYEYGIIKGHSLIGYGILKNLDFPWPVAQTVLQHHERLDGSGYPNGVRGDDILLEARILMVADVVEAMMGHRPYRAALGADAAMREIKQHESIRYDAEVVATCVRLFLERGFEFFDADTV